MEQKLKAAWELPNRKRLIFPKWASDIKLRSTYVMGRIIQKEWTARNPNDILTTLYTEEDNPFYLLKDKLIESWSVLNRKRFEADDAHIYPIRNLMERIQRVLFYRYNYYVSYSSPF